MVLGLERQFWSVEWRDCHSPFMSTGKRTARGQVCLKHPVQRPNRLARHGGKTVSTSGRARAARMLERGKGSLRLIACELDRHAASRVWHAPTKGDPFCFAIDSATHRQRFGWRLGCRELVGHSCAGTSGSCPPCFRRRSDISFLRHAPLRVRQPMHLPVLDRNGCPQGCLQ